MDERNPRSLPGLLEIFVKVLENISFILFTLMVIIVFINVAGRFIFQAGITEAEELAKILFVWLVFIGSALLSCDNKHIYVDIVVNALPQVPRRILAFISNICVSVILAILVWQGFYFVTSNIGLAMPMTKIPVAVVHAILPFSATMMFIINQYQLYLIIRGRD